jgi:GNAT superfamily N-acetyltransferase/predicted GNAT family acetyltransferase
MAFHVENLVQVSTADLAVLFNRAFTGYIGGSVTFDAPMKAMFLARENIDLTQSLVLVEGGERLGFALIARQGWTSRLAGMGIVPEAQEKRAGTWFMGQIMDAARQRGDHTMVLEAFEQNTRAVKLYERHHFRIVRRLYGFTADTLTADVSVEPREIDIYEAAKLIIQHGTGDLPWQVSGTAIARMTPPNRAYELDHTYIVISDPSRDTIVIRALLVHPMFERQGQATKLLKGLAALYPDKKWVVSPVCPQEYAMFFEKSGFSKNDLNQVQMEAMLLT